MTAMANKDSVRSGNHSRPFNSWGSSQELFSWDSLCDVNIPVPLSSFDATLFYSGTPLQRLNCLNDAAEYVQIMTSWSKSGMTMISPMLTKNASSWRRR